MPPRRSSRARASVELIDPPKAPASKRKRSEVPETVKEEVDAKPASRTRRSTSAAPIPRSRPSRARKSLEEVPETDEGEVEERPPPTKKSRPSLESEPEAIVVEEQEVEEDKPRARRASSRKPASKSTTRASTRSSKPPSRARRVVAVESDSDEARESATLNESQAEVKPASSVTKGRKIPTVAKVSDEEEAEVTPRANRKSEVHEETKVSLSSLKPNAQPDSDDDIADTSGAAAAKDIAQTPVEEEERSLLDPPEAVPSPSQTQAPVPEEPEGPKSRLVIHKMALVNFKSYAGRQEIGPFHKSFSSIVGPNGSGKSNTIDALLFVFGYRASKMRQGKLSELIHNSARYPDLEECSVEVHFRDIIDLPGPDAFEVVPISELVVTRTAFKNNSSRYTINGRQSSYTEVQTLLKGRGIDLDHNRFLILQGEVESIAQMKPKAASEHEDGLLEYLEDIIGTSKYKEPIEQALQQMERHAEDRVEKLNRLRIVEKDRNALEAKKKEAVEYLRMQNEHARAQSKLWQLYIWQSLLEIEKFEDKSEQVKKELDEEVEQNRDDVEHLEELKKFYEDKMAAYEEVKTATAAATEDLAAQEKLEIKLKEKLKHASGKYKKLQKAVQDDEKALAEAGRGIEDSSEKIEREKTRVEELEEELTREEKVLEGIRDSLKDKTQVFHDQIEVKQKELQPWNAKINAKQAEIDVATSERDMLVKKAEAAKTARAEAQEALGKLQEDHQAKVTELEELKSSKTLKHKEIKDKQKKSQDIQANIKELRGKASSSRQKAEEAKASQQASNSQNKVLDSLTRLKTAGRISGFHGRLGSLGTIPDKYDVAVSTACGALNNLVVDTVEQGQACIEYLRKQNVGRASFIVLEKLPKYGLDKIQTPEGVPRLFDLITPKEPRFAAAFYKGVSNTLVANDLEQANRIAFGGQRRWRVVTLAGQLIEASGAMSGGGNHVMRGGMSSKLQADAVSPDVLKRYEQDSEQAARELDEALSDMRAMETELEALQRSGPQLDMSIQKVMLDIQTGEKRIAEAEKRIRELKSHSQPDAGDVTRISQLERSIANFTQELEDIQERASSIEDEIKKLEKKILEIGGARLLTQKSKVDGIHLHINLANDEITKAEVAKTKAEKDQAKLQKMIESNGESIEIVEKEIQGLQSQLKGITDYVTQLTATVEQAQVAVESQKEKLDEIHQQVKEKEDEIQVFRKKEMELKLQLENIKKEMRESEHKLDHWKNLHETLRLEDIEEYEDDDEGENAEEVQGEEGVVKQEGESSSRIRHSSTELRTYTEDELRALPKRDVLVGQVELLDEKLKNARPDMSVLRDYRKREEEFLRRAHDLEVVTKLRDEKKVEYEGLTKQRLDGFMAGFSTISLKLKEMYQMITLGGNAELELVDSMDPFSEGIIFSVMPPKKSWKNISNLSGGEKTLSSLALVFALHVYKPTPLYFMDEIDAALDFRNVSIVANYIKDRTKNAQFIIISLRNDMFELSHRLIGIYKTANQTRSISIDNRPLHAIPVNAIPQPVAAS